MSLMASVALVRTCEASCIDSRAFSTAMTTWVGSVAWPDASAWAPCRGGFHRRPRFPAGHAAVGGVGGWAGRERLGALGGLVLQLGELANLLGEEGAEALGTGPPSPGLSAGAGRGLGAEAALPLP